MATVTLRKAAFYRTTVEKAIAELDLSTIVSVPAAFDPASLVNTISDASDEFQDALNRAERLEGILYAIRLAHGEANAACGIDAKTTQRAMMGRRIKRHEQIVALARVESAENMRAKLAVAMKQIETGPGRYGASHDTVDFVRLTAKQIETSKRTVIELKRAMRSIEDEITELNAKTTIQIADAHLDQLRDLGII